MRSWTDRYWLMFLIAVAVGFAIPEAWALLDSNPATDPLTGWTIERGFAEIATALGAFLVMHFGPAAAGGDMERPAESITAIGATILGALQIIVGAAQGGFDVNDLNDPELTGAITLLVGYIGAGITWYIARKQRKGQLVSAPDGTVQG